MHFCLTLICLCALLHEANRSIVKRKIATLVYTCWLVFHGDSTNELWLDYIPHCTKRSITFQSNSGNIYHHFDFTVDYRKTKWMSSRITTSYWVTLFRFQNSLYTHLFFFPTIYSRYTIHYHSIHCMTCCFTDIDVLFIFLWKKKIFQQSGFVHKTTIDTI